MAETDTPTPEAGLYQCRKSPDGYHCDHQQGQAHYSQPKNMMCCYCGRHHIEPPLPSGNAFTSERKHGPFYSPPRAMY